MKLQQLSIRDPEVQAFLWRYLEPSDFRPDYTKLDAIKRVEQECYDDTCRLFGDMEVGFMFRCTVRNPKVLEPHIMGDGRKLPEAIRQGAPIAWMMGFEKMMIWTTDKRIARIAGRFGFTRDADIPRVHLGKSGELEDLHVLSMENETCETLLS